MRKSITLLTILLTLGGTVGYSQSRYSEFNKFREQILGDFQNFKSRILEHYADFLEGEWHDFEPIMELASPYTQQKPTSLPVCEASVEMLETNGISSCLPDAMQSKYADSENLSNLSNIYPYTSVPGAAKALLTESQTNGKSNYELAAKRIPDPNFAFGSFPGQIKAPAPGESGIMNSGNSKTSMTKEDLKRAVIGSGYASKATFTTHGNDKYKFDFYGMEAFIPQIDFSIADEIKSIKQLGDNWRKMAVQKGGVETSRQLFGLAQQLGLNGYLTYRLTEEYVNQKFKDCNQLSRMAAVHFLLTNMGYDVRLTQINDNIFCVMLPFDQSVVYGLMGITIDGRKYYVMNPSDIDAAELLSYSSFRTCKLPKDAKGKSSDLRLTGLSIPFKPKDFEISHNGITIKGTVNENLKRLLHHYPQMPTGDFASSWIDMTLRHDIVDQLKSQIQDMSEYQAINTLMSLCHYGFKYATDQDNHGFEKPYFFEENFLWDRNDCEDRAIFFSYLVWNTLGLPCMLIQYPGHESVTIAANSDVKGCYYNSDGKRYFSADPTYLGSRIGMIMPMLQMANPSIDKHYK